MTCCHEHFCTCAPGVHKMLRAVLFTRANTWKHSTAHPQESGWMHYAISTQWNISHNWNAPYWWYATIWINLSSKILSKKRPQKIYIQQDVLFVNLKTIKMKTYTLKKYAVAVKLCKKKSERMLNTGGDGYLGWWGSGRSGGGTI